MRRAGGTVKVLGGTPTSNPYFVVSHPWPSATTVTNDKNLSSSSSSGSSSAAVATVLRSNAPPMTLPQSNTRYLRSLYVNMWKTMIWEFPLVMKDSVMTAATTGSSSTSPYYKAPEITGSYFSLWGTVASSPVIANWADTTIVSGSGSLLSPASGSTGQQFRFQGNRGKKALSERRLSHEEREERRRPKTKEEKKAKEMQLDEINNIVDTSYPEDCADIVEEYKAKGERIRDVLSNFGAVLEKLDVEVQGMNKPMAQLATVTKENATTFHLLPHKPVFLGPVATKLLRLGEPGIQVEKMTAAAGGVTKIKVEVPQLTQERRQQSVAKLAEFVREGKGKLDFQHEQTCGEVSEAAKKLAVGESVLKSLLDTMNATHKDNVELLEMEIEDIESQILNAGQDEEENEESS